MPVDPQSIQSIRVFNLKLLCGTVSPHIAPTSKQFVETLQERGMSISGQELSHLYLGTAPITDALAMRFETALQLSHGWLSFDHRLWLSASESDLRLFQQLQEIKPESKVHLANFLSSLKVCNS